MGNNILFYTLIGLFAGLFVALYLSSFKRFFYGKIQLKLTKKVYNYGENLQGTFMLHAKKEIQSKQLKVYLTVYQKQSGYAPNGGKATRQVEFARFTQDVGSIVTYKAGTKHDYNIDIKIPELSELFSAGEIPNAGTKKSRHTLLRSKRGIYTWEVRVKLEGESVNLSSSRYIFVSE